MGIITFEEVLELAKKNIYKKKNYDAKLIVLENSKDKFSPVFSTQNQYITNPRSQNSQHLLNRIDVKQQLYNGGEYEFKVINGTETKEVLGEPAATARAKYITSLTYSQPLWKNLKVNLFKTDLLTKKNDLEIAEIEDVIDTESQIDKVAFTYRKLAFNYQAFNILTEITSIMKNSKEDIDYRYILTKILNLFYPDDPALKKLLFGSYIPATEASGNDPASATDFFDYTALIKALENSTNNIDFYSNDLKEYLDDRLSFENIITEPFNEEVEPIDLNAEIKFALENRLEIKQKRKEIEQLDIDQTVIQNDSLPDIKLDLKLSSANPKNSGALSVFYDGKNTLTQKNLLKVKQDTKKNLERDLKNYERGVINRVRYNELQLKVVQREIDRIKGIIRQSSSASVISKADRTPQESILENIVQLILKYELSFKIFTYQTFQRFFNLSLKFDFQEFTEPAEFKTFNVYGSIFDKKIVTLQPFSKINHL